MEGNHAGCAFSGVGKYDRFVGGVDKGFYQHGGTIRPYFPIWTSDKVYDPELNPDGVYPRITGTSWYESGAGNTSYRMRNGAYLRLKNLNIGYDLPMAILRPLESRMLRYLRTLLTYSVFQL